MSVVRSALRRRTPVPFSIILLLAAFLLAPSEGRSQGPARKGKTPEGGFSLGLGTGGTGSPARKPDAQSLELLKMGFLEFWEKEEDLWRRIEKLLREADSVEGRLLALEKEKAEVLGRLRRLRRERRPPAEKLPDLLALRKLSLSIRPLAARRARVAGELRPLLERWMLFQALAPEVVLRESGRYQEGIAASVVRRFTRAFQAGSVRDVEGLLFRGIRVNDRWGHRGYLRHLEDYFRRVRVVAFEVRDRVFREVNPFTLRVKGKFELEERERRPKGKAKPRTWERSGAISFTLRELSGRWLISQMTVPD